MTIHILTCDLEPDRMQGHQQQGSAPFPYGSAAVPFQQLQPGVAPVQVVKPPPPHEDSSELVRQHPQAAAAALAFRTQP